MLTLWQDIRYIARMLLKNPGISLIAVLTLALGIGANTAIFSVVNGVLLNALPYPQPEQLVMVWCDNRRQGIRDDITSYPNFVDWRDRNKTFQGMAGVRPTNFTLTGVGEPEQIRAANVSINFFQMVGMTPVLGRGFTAEEEQPGKDRKVVLSHGLWQRRFSGDPGILNKEISLSGEPNIVVGIMPPEFQTPDNIEIWRPLAPIEGVREARGTFWLPVVGRLKQGVTRAMAQADLDLIAKQIEQQYPDLAGYGVNVVPLVEQTVGPIRRVLMILFGAVLFVLMIACANVTYLLLTRAAVRRHEVAVRAVPGAGRWRVVRQLLTEGMLLGVLSGALGVLLAWWGLQLLFGSGPANFLRPENFHLGWRVLWFTLILSLFTGLICGLAPALQTRHLKLDETLTEDGRTSVVARGGRRAQRIRGVFIVAEVALTLPLLVGAGLFVRSYWRLQQVDSGFKADHLLTLQLTLPRSKYRDDVQTASFFERLQERLAALPGVVSASATSGIMLPKRANSVSFFIENRPQDPRELALELPLDVAQSNYFQTMGVELLRGRSFTAQDTHDSPKVAIVNETFVKRYFPNEDPVGKRFALGNRDDDDDKNEEEHWITIVGVVRDTRRQGLDRPIRIESWMPLAQRPSSSMEVALRTTGDPLALRQAAREAVWSLDRDLPILKIQTMEQVLSGRVAQRRFNMLLLGLFALMALILLAVGIYGVMSYAVTERALEIGIRSTLGAQTGDVPGLVVRQGMKLILTGVVIGLAATIALSRFIAGLLFDVRATDPITFVAIAVLLTGVALAACWIPARRAAKVNPMIASL